MKKLFTLFVFVLFPFLINSQPLLTVDFSGGYPPAGWTIDFQPGNWSAVNSVNAGGTAPELRFNCSPQFNATTHFISPAVNLTGQTSVSFNLNIILITMVDHILLALLLDQVLVCGIQFGRWLILLQVHKQKKLSQLIILMLGLQIFKSAFSLAEFL